MKNNWNELLSELEYCLKNLYEYVVKENLGASINMGIYFTIILSVLMVYGIFLSFLQYAVKGYSSSHLYMGRDLYKESLFAKNKLMWNLTNKKYVTCFCLMESLPIMAKFAILGAKEQMLHNGMLAFWMVINFLVAGTFMIVFVKCARGLMGLMNSKEEELLRREASAYNDRYMEKCRKKGKPDADKFETRISAICKYWNEDVKLKQCDDGGYTYNYDNDYLNLINRLIDFYGEKRYRYIKWRRWIKVEKEESGILYNLKIEIDILNRVCEMAMEKNVKLYEFLLKRNTLLKNGVAIYIDHIEENKLFDFQNRTLKELIDEYFVIYEFCSKDCIEHNKRIDFLMKYLRDDINFFGKLGEDKIKDRANRAAKRIFENNVSAVVKKENETALYVIFSGFNGDSETKRWFIDWLDSYIVDNKVDMELFQDIIAEIKKEERVYILLHLFFYYSIYDFRFTWEYFDINLLRGLVDGGDRLVREMEEESQLVENLKKPMNMWRFNVIMYTKLMEYLQQPMSMDHLTLVKEENIINYKYYFALRVVCWKEQDEYDSYEIKDQEMQRDLLKFISLHPEFFEDRDFPEFFAKLRKANYQQIELGKEIEQYSIEELVIGNFGIKKLWIKDLIRNNTYPAKDAFDYLVLSYASSDKYEEFELWIRERIPFYESEVNEKPYLLMLLDIYECYKIEKGRRFEAKLKELFSKTDESS